MTLLQNLAKSRQSLAEARASVDGLFNLQCPDPGIMARFWGGTLIRPYVGCEVPIRW